MTTSTFVTMVCANAGCSNHFEWEILPGFEKPNDLLCDDCEKVRDLAFHEAQEAAKRETADRAAEEALRELHEATPEIYRGTDVGHPKFNRNLWESCQDWIPTKEEPWFGLVGSKSGQCKTRVAFLLLRALIERGRRSADFQIITSYELKRLALSQYGKADPDAPSPRQRLERLASCDILLLDDIGKSKHTLAVAEELFSIIDHRYANLLPMIWTSNCHPREFAADIADKELSGPMVGRIIERSMIVDLD